MNCLDALRRMVNSFPGGRPVVALRLGKTDEVLRKELSAMDKGHKLGLATAIEIVELCHAQGSDNAEALAIVVSKASGGAFNPAPPLVDASDGQVMSSISMEIKESADLTRAVLQALEDGRITDVELKHIEKEALDLLLRVSHLVDTCRSRNASLRANAPRQN